MTSYLALLRGVNVSGKNKLAMSDLKAALTACGFADVFTLLNSGNAGFRCGEADPAELAQAIRGALRERCSLEVPVLVLPLATVEDILAHSPDWWGGDDPAVYHNLIFLLPPASVDEVFAAVGAPKDGLEQVSDYGSAIFWSFSRRDYAKTNWWPRTAAEPFNHMLTIRTAGTMRKLAAQCRKQHSL